MPIITCPSGLTGEIRHLTIRDGRWLTDRRLQRKGKIIDRILEECWIKTIDNGIYDFGTTLPEWGNTLIGDRDYALIAIRHESWGTYEFKITCSSCGEPINWDLDLEELLEEQKKPLEDVSKKIFSDGNIFTTEIELLGQPREVSFKLAVGKDSQKAFQERKKAKRRTDIHEENVLLDAVKVRLISISGVKGEELDDYLESLPMRSLHLFVNAFDKQDCGVDTSVEYECTSCGAKDDVDLPFDQGFFFPKLRR